MITVKVKFFSHIIIVICFCFILFLCCCFFFSSALGECVCKKSIVDGIISLYARLGTQANQCVRLVCVYTPSFVAIVAPIVIIIFNVKVEIGEEKVPESE